MPQKREWKTSPWIKLRPKFLEDYYRSYKPLVQRIAVVALPRLQEVMKIVDKSTHQTSEGG
jgi:hypothetical protein